MLAWTAMFYTQSDFLYEINEFLLIKRLLHEYDNIKLAIRQKQTMAAALDGFVATNPRAYEN